MKDRAWLSCKGPAQDHEKGRSGRSRPASHTVSSRFVGTSHERSEYRASQFTNFHASTVQAAELLRRRSTDNTTTSASNAPILIYSEAKTPNLLANVNLQKRNTIYISLRSLHCHTGSITNTRVKIPKQKTGLFR